MKSGSHRTTRPKAATTERLEMTPGFRRSMLCSTVLKNEAKQEMTRLAMEGWTYHWALTIHWAGTTDSGGLRSQSSRSTVHVKIANHSTR